MVSDVEEDAGGVGDLESEFDGRLSIRIVGWNAPGGGESTERGEVAEGEIIRAGIGFGAFVFLQTLASQLY
jgi:hypothetical protein